MHKPHKKSTEINWWSLKEKDIKSWPLEPAYTILRWLWNLDTILLALFFYTRNMCMIEKWEHAGNQRKELIIESLKIIDIYLYM